jgi:hypothetical protein
MLVTQEETTGEHDGCSEWVEKKEMQVRCLMKCFKEQIVI